MELIIAVITSGVARGLALRAFECPLPDYLAYKDVCIDHDRVAMIKLFLVVPNSSKVTTEVLASHRTVIINHQRRCLTIPFRSRRGGLQSGLSHGASDPG